MKLPKNYVPGQGEVKATAFGGIGQRLLEKHGWQNGEGLGKDKSGMKEALDVKKKEDTLGVGANGAWDWSRKFWEDAYNSALQTVSKPNDNDGSTTSNSTDEKLSTRSSGQPSTSGSDSSSSSSSDESDGATTRGRRRRVRQHRDGTHVSVHASQAELNIAAQLAKDPWGRWGGKGGKMERIKRQEEQAAQRARELLSQGQAKGVATTGGADSGQAAKGSQPAKQRIVVVLKSKGEGTLLAERAAFVRTPSAGWWGANYFVSAGALEGLETKTDQQPSKRQTFNEDDQANLYMKVLEGQRVGHKGLGKSTTVNIGGGWAGTKKTFEEGDHTTQQQEQQEQPPDNAASQPAQQPEATMQTQSGKKKRRRAQSGSGEPEQPAPLTQPCEETTTVEARPKPKWLKVARILLKQAPKRRLRLEELCKQMLLHQSEKGSLKRSTSEEKLTSLLHKKAKKQKVVINDGFVTLPKA